MKKILTTILAAALAGGVWGDGDAAVAPPTASIMVMNADQMEAVNPGAKELLSSIPVNNIYESGTGYTVEWSPFGTTSAAEAYVFTPTADSTSEEVKTTYGNYFCDYVVSFDKGVDKNSVILAGHYGSMTMSFPIPKDFAGNNADEMFLLDSVVPGWITYNFIVGNVGTFICTALNVSEENVGKKITVSLVIWPADGDKVADRHVVATIEYPFTKDNLTTLDIEDSNLGKVPYRYVSSGLDEQFGRVLDGAKGVVAQTVEGPHFSPSYKIDVGEPDAQGAVAVDVKLNTATQPTIATVTVTTDESTTIESIDVEKTVDTAVKEAASLFALGGANTIEIKLQVSESGAADEAVVYDVTPIAIINDDPDHAVDLSNDDLAANASFTFNLDVTGIADVGGKVKVVHTSSDTAKYPDETFTVTAVAGAAAGAVVAPITTSHFSTFTLSAAAAEPAVNTVVSANAFGALAITGNAAKPAYVAVPFGAFGDGDAPIAAADVVQAAALSDGDKMYVWNGAEGTQQKYEVYKVDAKGAWTVENKVTVAADGSVTTDSTPAEALPVASGKGVFIERTNTAKPLYVYGQVLTNTVAETAFEKGLTLVSAPSLKAMGEIDLNALTWEGVTALKSKTVRGKAYPDWSKIATADYLYYRTATGATARCYYCGGQWITENNKTPGKIPAGTAFWYCARAAGAKVVW